MVPNEEKDEESRLILGVIEFVIGKTAFVFQFEHRTVDDEKRPEETEEGDSSECGVRMWTEGEVEKSGISTDSYE